MKKHLTYIIPQFLCVMIAVAVIIYKLQSSEEPVSLRQVSFDRMPGWLQSKVRKSVEAFKFSCKTFLKQNPEQFVGSKFIPMHVKDWQPACRAVMKVSPVTERKARQFFQHWFKPVEFYNGKPVEGLFTGYYSPLLKGSLN